ncbi:MAG TPA: DinB family protein [Vicinamibacterales bacterium]|nr:DinB family protein [Vicinamibacterales bacterium]
MIGRPGPSEAAPYYFTYIDRVIGEDALGVLASQLGETVTLCADVSEERSLYRYAEDKWSIRQVLNHVTDAERVFAFRALWFARGFETALPSYDQNVAVPSAEADRIAWSTHIEEFRRVRLASLALFQNMPSTAWMRSGIASDHPFTVRALAYIIAGHLVHHVALLRQRYLQTQDAERCL